MRRLIALAKEYHLIGADFGHEQYLKPSKGDKESSWDIWLIRKEALERKLTDIEFFRVLYHIAKHRGFFFHTKAEETQEEKTNSERGKAKAGLARIRQKLEDGKWQTVGQMFWEEFKQTNPESKRKRNTSGKYEHSIHRTLLRDEITKIFLCQRSKFKNGKATEVLEDRYINEVLMYEEGPDDKRLEKMMGRCELIQSLCAREGRTCEPNCTRCLCAPKESYSAERFSLFSRLNVLELVDIKSGAKVKIDGHQAQIEALAYKNAKVTFAQIRTALGLEDKLHLRFNLCSYREKNPEYNEKLECEIKNGRLQFGEQHKVPVVNIRTGAIEILDGKIKDVFSGKKLWPNAKKMHVYYSDIRKQLNLSGDYRFKNLSGYTKSAEEFGSEAKYIKQFEYATFIELGGYHKIRKAIEEKCGSQTWQTLSADTAALDTVAEALTYRKSDQTRAAYLQERQITDSKLIQAVLTLNMDKLATFSKEALVNLLQHMETSGGGLLFHEAKEKCGYKNVDHHKQAVLEPYTGFFEKNPVVSRVFAQTRKVVNAVVRKYNGSYPIDQIHIEVATELANNDKRKAEIAQGQARYREEKVRAEERCREAGINPDEGHNLLMFRLAEEQNNRCPYTDKWISYSSKVTSENGVYILDCEIDHVIPMSRSFNDSLKNKVLCTRKANQDKRDRLPAEWFQDTYGPDSDQWAQFEHRISRMLNMPYAKRKNLLRKSWTEEDKEKFISRNLNDTRYAARHIAEYLRKYFDFSRSQREDIKEVSRIQLRSGGITAFLRHMWGLNKSRDDNDLHHALDALVVACSTYGHVYLVSNLAKQIERAGKSWYKHFGREKFTPWDRIREDIDSTAKEVFVSRMPRHKATSPAHKDTVLKKSEPVRKRVLKVNGGYAEMDEMIRADVFADESGKNYVVPIYAVDIFSRNPLPDKYLKKNDAPYNEWPSVTEDHLKFRFSIFKDDLVSVDGAMYYVNFVRGTRAKINLRSIDGSLKDREVSYRNVILKKYAVDVLGSYKEVKEEKRIGNEGVKRVKKRRPK